ncbi:unnamed protein product [Lota lota]
MLCNKRPIMVALPEPKGWTWGSKLLKKHSTLKSLLQLYSQAEILKYARAIKTVESLLIEGMSVVAGPAQQVCSLVSQDQQKAGA